MKNGFIKVAAASPKLRVADVEFNTGQIIAAIYDAANQGAKLVAMPELGICAYTCGDLFFQSSLIRVAENALLKIVQETAQLDILAVVGLPVSKDGKLYNCAAFVKGGEILGFVPKSYLPNHDEHCESRYFNTMNGNSTVKFCGNEIPIGTKLIFEAYELPEFSVAAEICEDLWAAAPPSNNHTANGANIIVNLSASPALVGKRERRNTLAEVQSTKTLSAYIFADASEGESTTDLAFSGHNVIYEVGEKLCEAEPFSNGIIYTDIDVERIILERRRNSTFSNNLDNEYIRLSFHTSVTDTKLCRSFEKNPFVPENKNTLTKRCKEVFEIQYRGLKKRLMHIGAKTVTLGISGGLDSTLALLVTAKAFESLGLPTSEIIAVTMPCFGTSDRTFNNAKAMVKEIGATLREINIKDSVTLHLSDIGADVDCHDVTYENAQARERTQILMDIANKTGGIVIGTGDLSELALGFATYNGDHMSMYGVNASVPKTLIRHIVRYIADTSDNKLKSILYDVVDTPVSPELLPPEADGTITQQTEEIVGPYELHDFYLYNLVRRGFSKEKIYRIACYVFDGIYDSSIIEKWLGIFINRFYASQFKRSCLPDGVKVGSVSLSPRGDFKMPSDATVIR